MTSNLGFRLKNMGTEVTYYRVKSTKQTHGWTSHAALIIQTIFEDGVKSRVRSPLIDTSLRQRPELGALNGDPKKSIALMVQYGSS